MINGKIINYFPKHKMGIIRTYHNDLYLFNARDVLSGIIYKDARVTGTPVVNSISVKNINIIKEEG